MFFWCGTGFRSSQKALTAASSFSKRATFQKGLTSGFLFAALWFSTSSFAQSEPIKAVVFPVELHGDSPVEPIVVKAALQASLEENASFQILSEQERFRLLSDAEGLGVVCEPKVAACWAKVGILGGVDYVLFPSLTSSSFNLVAVNVEASSATKVDRELTAATAAIQIRSAVIEAVAPERFFGTLTVTTTPSDASVVLDGEEIATSPMRAAGPFVAGSHSLVVRKGDLEKETEISIPFEGHLEIHLELARTAPGENEVAPLAVSNEGSVTDGPSSLWTSPLFLTGAGIAGVSAVALVGFSIGVGVLELMATSELGLSLEDRNKNSNQARHKELQALAIPTYAGAGLFLTTAVAGAALATSAALIE